MSPPAGEHQLALYALSVRGGPVDVQGAGHLVKILPHAFAPSNLPPIRPTFGGADRILERPRRPFLAARTQHPHTQLTDLCLTPASFVGPAQRRAASSHEHHRQVGGWMASAQTSGRELNLMRGFRGGGGFWGGSRGPVLWNCSETMML